MDEDNPFVVFKQWMSEAEKNEINDPNAVALATVKTKLINQMLEWFY